MPDGTPPLMIVYLAARYSRREELLGYRRQLEALGIEVSSRWLLGQHQATDEQLYAAPHTPGGRWATQIASEDFADVMAADTLIAFSEAPRSTRTRGGRHTELGVALGAGKRTIVCGPIEQIFCALPQVEHYLSWPALYAALRAERVANSVL